MIKNEKRYKIICKKLIGVMEDIAQLQAEGDQLPAKDRLILASLLHLREEMKHEIAVYFFY